MRWKIISMFLLQCWKQSYDANVVPKLNWDCYSYVLQIGSMWGITVPHCKLANQSRVHYHNNNPTKKGEIACFILMPNNRVVNGRVKPLLDRFRQTIFTYLPCTHQWTTENKWINALYGTFNSVSYLKLDLCSIVWGSVF